MIHIILLYLVLQLSYSSYSYSPQVSWKKFKYVVAHLLESRPKLFEVFGQLPLDLLQSPRTNSGDDSTCVIRDKHIRSHGGPDWYRARDSCIPKLKTRNSYYLRVTMVWATRGSRSGAPLDKGETISTLEEWAEAEVVPDVVVVGEYKVLPLSYRK